MTTLFEEPATELTATEVTADWLLTVGYEPMCKGSKMLFHRKATMFAWLDGYIGVGNSTTGWVRPKAVDRQKLQRMVRDVYGFELCADSARSEDMSFEDEPE